MKSIRLHPEGRKLGMGWYRLDHNRGAVYPTEIPIRWWILQALQHKERLKQKETKFFMKWAGRKDADANSLHILFMKFIRGVV